MSAELFLKAVADATRIRIISSLMESPKFVEQLAKELDITVSTASFHLKKLQAVGFVVSKKEQYYQTYSVNSDALRLSIFDIVSREKEVDTHTFESEVVSQCFSGGKLKAFPKQIKKREVLLSEIAKLFKVGKNYSEREVNVLIADVYDEFILIKNELIKYGYLERTGQNMLRRVKSQKKEKT